MEQAGKSDYAFEAASLVLSFALRRWSWCRRRWRAALAREEPERAWDALQESNEDLPWVLGWKATLLDHNGETEKAYQAARAGRERFGEDRTSSWKRPFSCARQFYEEAMTLSSTCSAPVPDRSRRPTFESGYFLRQPVHRRGSGRLAGHALELDGTDEQAVAVELTSAFYRARRYREALDVCLSWVDRGQVLPPQMTVYVVLSHAGLAEPQEALEKLPISA